MEVPMFDVEAYPDVLYVVQVTHTGGATTDVAVPVLITQHPVVALTAAFGAEEAGYRFFRHSGGVCVFRVETEKMYHLEPLTIPTRTFPGTCVFARLRNPRIVSGWHEFWFDKDLEKAYGKVFAPLTA